MANGNDDTYVKLRIRRTVRKPGVRTSSEICLGGIGVRECCCQSCARDRKKSDGCAIIEKHNGAGLQATTRVAWREIRTCLRAFQFMAVRWPRCPNLGSVHGWME